MKGHIRRRGKRSWAIVLDIGRDASGKRQQRWHAVRGTKQDAERELGHLLHAFNSGGYVEPTKITTRQYLERWIADYARSNVAGKTLERYQQMIDDHVAPEIGHIRLAKLQPLHIQSLYAAKLANGRKDGGGGLAAQTVVHMHRILRTALGQAVKWQLLARNPVDAVEPPRAAHKEMRALDEQESAKLLAGFERSRLYTPVFVAVTTGLRRGELLALRWTDLDLDAGQLIIGNK